MDSIDKSFKRGTMELKHETEIDAQTRQAYFLLRQLWCELTWSIRLKHDQLMRYEKNINSSMVITWK
jgi:hypothetical protein